MRNFHVFSTLVTRAAMMGKSLLLGAALLCATTLQAQNTTEGKQNAIDSKQNATTDSKQNAADGKQDNAPANMLKPFLVRLMLIAQSEVVRAFKNVKVKY